MTPEIEIRFEQLHTMKTELEAMFASLIITDDAIKSNPLMFVKASIKNEIHHVLNFLFSDDLKQKISRIIVEIHYENSKSSKTVAAYFNLLKSEKSQAGEYYFGIYFSVIKGKIFQYLNSGSNGRIDNLWAHELIHLMDFGNLNSFHKRCQIEIENWRVKSTSNEIHYNEIYNRSDTPIYLQVLDLFSHFRNEGIAQLHSVFQGEGCLFSNTSYSLAKIQFKEQLNQVGSKLSQPYLSRQEQIVLSEHIKRFRQLAYSIGHYMILSVLTNSSNQKIKFYASKCIEFLDRNQPFQIHPSLIKDMIYHSIKIDLGEFLYRLCFYQNVPVNGFYSLEELLSICNLFTMNNFHNDFRAGFLEHIYRCAKFKDVSGFKTALTDVIGGAMDQDEVVAEFEKLRNCVDRNFFLEKEVFEKAKRVMEHYTLKADELSSVTLTYILDSEDLIDDSIKYFGYLDDLFVLDSYFLLIE